MFAMKTPAPPIGMGLRRRLLPDIAARNTEGNVLQCSAEHQTQDLYYKLAPNINTST